MKTKPLFLLAAIGLTALSLAGCASVQSGGSPANIAMLNGQVTKKDFPAIKKKVKQFTASDLRKLIRNYRTVKYVSFLGTKHKTVPIAIVKWPLGSTMANFKFKFQPTPKHSAAHNETVKNAKLYGLRLGGRYGNSLSDFYYLPPANFSHDKNLALLVNFILKNNTSVVSDINAVGRHHETALYIAAAMGMPHVTWVLLNTGKANPAIWAYQASDMPVRHLNGSRCCQTFTAMAGGTWGNNCIESNFTPHNNYIGINTGVDKNGVYVGTHQTEQEFLNDTPAYRIPQRAYPYQAFMRFNYIYQVWDAPDGLNSWKLKPFTPFEKVVLKELENGTAKAPDICGAVLNEN